MRVLSIDLETFSSVNLTTSGVHKYTESPDFEILIMAYAFDNGPIKAIDLTQESRLPKELAEALQDKQVLKTAWNANFELRCLMAQWPKLNIDPWQWDCTMIRSLMLGLPGGLDSAGNALGLDTTKLKEGKDFLKLFCSPCKPTRTNNGRTRNLPAHFLDKWIGLIEYCKIDVQQERKIRNKLSFYKIQEQEKRLWELDFRINSRGIEVDPVLVLNAIKIAAEYEKECLQQAVKITGLSNPKSTAQIKKWLLENTGEEIESLNKKSMPGVLAQLNGSGKVVDEVLRLRNELSKTSVKKYDSMLRCTCDDGRARGLLQYYGAARTGRWSGKLIQVQNLKRNSMEQLDLAREYVRAGDLASVEMLWDSPPEVLSQLTRTAFVAPKGKVFISTDFSAIEARITAWLAEEQWRLDVFKTHGKIYEASASMMFKIPIEKITKNSPERFKGKCAELALGFGGGPPALINIGALQMGMTEEELPKIVRMWRNVNKKIFRYWYTIANQCIEAVDNPGMLVPSKWGISFLVKDKRLWITLPSGRHLIYLNPSLKPDEKGNDRMVIHYDGVDQYTKKFTDQRTYGGKLVENIVQATARDVLGYAMLDLDKAGYKIVMHVHDEVIMEVDEGKAASSVLDINRIMALGQPWTKGLPLGAESSVLKYYKKE